jgi:hypothetical protein
MKILFSISFSKMILFIIGVISIGIINAQSPEGITYQAVVRNADGTLMVNTQVILTFKIHDGGPNGVVVFEESQSLVSNAQGLVTCVIGNGAASVGNFADIDWSSGTKFLHTLMGSVDLGSQQMLSVPYSLESKHAQVSDNGFSRVSETGDTLFLSNGQFVLIPGISVANFPPPPTPILGCTDPLSCTFNPLANESDGSCGYINQVCDDGNNLTLNDTFNSYCQCQGVYTSNPGSSYTNNEGTPVGTIVSNFNLTDINGNTHDLFSYLDAGKMVVINISATWAYPCWNYFSSGALNDFYLTHGPSGANDAMTLFIEGDPSTTMADLNGTGTNTQGNFVTGAQYPIIDLTSLSDLESSGLLIPYYPKMYVICPNRMVIQSGVSGAIGTLSLLESYVGSCSAPASNNIDPVILKYLGDDVSCGSFNLSIRIQNNSLLPLTNCAFSVSGIPSPFIYNWTGNLASYGTADINLGNISISNSSNVNITVSSADTNPANSTISQLLNYVNASENTPIPYTQDFSQSGFPYYNWRNINEDNYIGWEIYNGNTSQGSCLLINNYDNNAIGVYDHVITAPFDLTGADSPSVKFKVANRRWSADYYDKLMVSVSTSCDGPWIQVWSKESADLSTGPDFPSGWQPVSDSDWRQECIDLTNHANVPSLFIRFTSENHWGNGIFLDDIQIQNAVCN